MSEFVYRPPVQIRPQQPEFFLTIAPPAPNDLAAALQTTLSVVCVAGALDITAD